MANRITIALVGFRGPTENRRVSVATEGLRSGEAVALGAFFDCTATMFANPTPAKSKGGATWKHLWSPIREVRTHEERVKHATSVRVLLPETHQLIRIPADTLPERVVRRSRINVEAPTMGAMAPAVSVKVRQKARYRRPKAHANSGFVRAITRTRVNSLPPVPTVVVLPISLRAKSYYSYYTPEAVQNLTEEMIMWL